MTVTPAVIPALVTPAVIPALVICATVALLGLLNPSGGDPPDKPQEEEYIVLKRKPKS